MKDEEKPWACIRCNQMNTHWATECGRCGWKNRANSTYDEGFGAGYAQAIGDVDAELKKRGDTFGLRQIRKTILALVRVRFDTEEDDPQPDWTRYRVPAVRDYPKAE